MSLFDSLLAYYKLDNASGSVSLVDSAGSHPLTQYGTGVSVGTGKISGCATFTAASTRFQTSLPSSSQFSISLWAKGGTQSAKYPELCTNNASNGIEFNFSHASGLNKFRGVISGHQVVGITTVTNNQWHHGVLTWDGSSFNLYTDGNLEASASFSAGLIDFSSLTFGDSIDANTQLQFIGSLDEIGVWRRALTASEVSSLYATGNGLTYTPATVSDGHGGTCLPGNMDCAGYCNGSHVYDCSGTCGGSATADTCGVCGGGCTKDCSSGYCYGGYGGCLNDPSACNYDQGASYDDGSCYNYKDSCHDSCGNCTCGNCGLGCGSATDDCGNCNQPGQGCYSGCDLCGNCGNVHGGCQSSNACNFDSCANFDDGSCSYGSGDSTCGCNNPADACGNCGNYHGGCLTGIACNPDSCANYDDGSCTYDQGCGCGNGWSGSLPTSSQVLTGVTFSEGQFSYTGTLQPGVPKSKVILSAALGIPIM